MRAAIERHAEQVLTQDLLEPVERVDAVVSGAELTLGLAEELLRAGAVRSLATRRRAAGPAPGSPTSEDGGGRSTPGSRSAPEAPGRARSRSAATGGCRRGGEPLDASFRLERNAWDGAVEPRLVCVTQRPARRRRSWCSGEPEDDLDGGVTEVDRSSSYVDRSTYDGSRNARESPAAAIGRSALC